MRVTVVGTGYVGLVTGTCLAESGNKVACVDIDAKKIERLQKGEIPIYEPGLEDLVDHNLRDGRLSFTTDLAAGLQGSKLVFIGVGTPPRPDGSANLSALFAVVDQIRAVAKQPTLVVVKSTVPVGTNAQVLKRLNDGGAIAHTAASNPEFLKEGCAVEDFMKPDRVVVGVREKEASDLLHELHAPFLRTGHPFLSMSPESAEMTKYVANAMLATKISFINEMANVCERWGADINKVREGIGHDSRIGFQFLHPGVGYGGSCFPKDITSLISIAEKVGVEPRILSAVHATNEHQKRTLFGKLNLALKDLKGKTIAVWGLAFKPRTDDIREAPSLVLIESLLAAGAKVRTHDPRAMDNVRKELGDKIAYCDLPYDALDGADALAIVTEWQEFRTPDFEEMKARMRQPVIVDGRNLYDPALMKQRGFVYLSVGRQSVQP